MLDDYFFDANDYATSIMGDISITLDGSREDFPDVPLSMVSPALMEAALIIAGLAAEGEEETVTIPDHDPVLRMERKGRTALVSVVMAGRALSSAQCDLADIIREVGALHRSVTDRLLSKNPHLIQSHFFRYMHIGANYFANKQLREQLKGQH